jgi:organic hydroperoxide reductase OsmC/OhrA
MTQVGKVLYTAKTHTTGGREHGTARSSGGHLNIKLSSPGNPYSKAIRGNADVAINLV